MQTMWLLLNFCMFLVFILRIYCMLTLHDLTSSAFHPCLSLSRPPPFIPVLPAQFSLCHRAACQSGCGCRRPAESHRGLRQPLCQSAMGRLPGINQHIAYGALILKGERPHAFHAHVCFCTTHIFMLSLYTADGSVYKTANAHFICTCTPRILRYSYIHIHAIHLYI